MFGKMSAHTSIGLQKICHEYKITYDFSIVFLLLTNLLQLHQFQRGVACSALFEL